MNDPIGDHGKAGGEKQKNHAYISIHKGMVRQITEKCAHVLYSRRMPYSMTVYLRTCTRHHRFHSRAFITGVIRIGGSVYIHKRKVSSCCVIYRVTHTLLTVTSAALCDDITKVGSDIGLILIPSHHVTSPHRVTSQHTIT